MADECESKGAESKGLKRKRKHIRDLNLKDAKQKKIVKSCKRNRTVKKDQTIQPQLPKTATEMSSNWKCLQALLQKERKVQEEKGGVKMRSKKTFKKSLKTSHTLEKTASSSEVWFDDVDPEDLEEITGKRIQTSSNGDPNDSLVTGNLEGLTKKIALDCEMVGVGFDGKRHMLARVSIVNSHGHVVYDSFVAPQEKVVDYRTPVSGIRPANLKNAPDFKTVQLEVSKLLKGKILVGHALKNDLEVLLLDHPRKNIRDTAKYKPFQEMVKSKMPALRILPNNCST
ncbi:REX4, RNA exonuclease 4 [Desmophyllum pertusum]|uniref:RNA exonuclease 4 n=1 Tax=Desmophyllum pertusum TaxID=174260 RepID=A0A9X0A2B1_9CNID|nr:REX4, RNA exonuclease 4 [Desmophyllum pertusum]